MEQYTYELINELSNKIDTYADILDSENVNPINKKLIEEQIKFVESLKYLINKIKESDDIFETVEFTEKQNDYDDDCNSELSESEVENSDYD